ncbi:hypothetical protein J3Q64DRAFT_1837109 [Phycomyces blakesleeanus]|uniref:DM2 domain-containing protein n=1 Tax=Phycomyces blakesleeanus TaxID=4837 RepID=A0ABR3ASV8_PHYBL
MLHEKLEEYNSAFEKIMEELEEPEMPEDPKSSAPSTTDETPKKTNKAARATTTTTTTTANDNGSNIDSAEQTGKTTITSENIEAEASKAVEQALSPECYPVLDAESKLITPGKIRRKVLRYISSQKLKGKKTDDQTAETNRVGCLSQRRVQGLDDFLHADYMSDLETDCEVEDN